MMPNQHKLPTIDGTERELRDGDRVRLRCGIDDTIKRDRETNSAYVWDGLGYWTWAENGKSDGLKSAESDLDIVLILGPEREEHDDGTETRLCTLPVTMPKDAWKMREPARVGCPKKCEQWLDTLGLFRSGHGDEKHGYLILRPKSPPAPHPWLQELARLLESGETVLPPGMQGIRYEPSIDFLCRSGFWRCWCRNHNGPLPPREADTPNEVTIEEIRAAVEYLRRQENKDG